MEFKKINDRRFQCRLDEEDLEDNNISLDDFFKNDTDKIHSLLEVIMEEAEKNIGVTLSGEVMSLQLAPQPDHSILLTVSSGKEDLGNMLRKAGESISKAFSKPEKSNVIKNGEGTFKDAPFETFGDSLDKFELPDAQTDELKKTGQKKKASNVIKAGCGVFRLESLNDFEEMCTVSSRTWGITNALYKNKEDDTYYILDYKTGSAPKNAKFDYQTMIYLLAVSKFFKTDKVKFIYIDLKNKEELAVEYSPELGEEYQKRLVNAAGKINSDEIPPKKTECNCEYKAVCF